MLRSVETVNRERNSRWCKWKTWESIVSWKPRKKVFLEYGDTQLCPGQLSTSLEVSRGHVLEGVGSVYVLVIRNVMDK